MADSGGSSSQQKAHAKRLAVILLVFAFHLILFGIAPVDGKRAFAIRMRSKSNHNTGAALGRNSRKNYHHMHQEGVGGMVRNPPVPDIQPPRPIGWSVDGHSNSHPIGPPPAYPGLGHHAVPAGGAPPAYSHSRLNPPSYGEAMGHHQSSYAVGAAAPLVAPRHYDYNHNSALYGDSNAIGSSYGSSYGYQHRASSPFSMGSILTGAALWHVAHGIGHHHHHNHQHYGAVEHGINSEEHYYHNNHHHHGDGEMSTLPPEVENSHIQVNANFDFGPSPNPQEAQSHDSTTSETTLTSVPT